MRAVLCLCILVTATYACPTLPCVCPLKCEDIPPCEDIPSSEGTSSCEDNPPSEDPSLSICVMPTYIPEGWQVKHFDREYMSKILCGTWYLQSSSSVYLPGQKALQCGWLHTGWPGCSNLVVFEDSTHDVCDNNLDITMIEYAYNYLTEDVDVIRAKLKKAYSNKCTNLCIFTMATQSCYENPLVDIEHIDDQNLLRHDLNDIYKTEYVVAFIDTDCTNKYLILVIIERYKYLISSVNKGYLAFVLTRDQVPESEIYQKIINDFDASGLSYYGLMNVDQSYTFSLPSLETSSDIVESDTSTASTLSTTTKSCSSTSSTTDEFGTTVSSSTSSVKTTTVSTIITEVDTKYEFLYEFIPYPVPSGCTPVYAFTNIQLDVIGNLFTGKYFVRLTTPFSYGPCTDATKIGIFNTGSICSSLEVCFGRKESDSPFDDNTPILMLERGLNLLTNQVQETRTVITIAQVNGCIVLNAFTEGYYTIQMTPITSVDGNKITLNNPEPDLYKHQYSVLIIGFECDVFIIFYIIDLYSNILCSETPENQIIVLTREIELSKSTFSSINQHILRAGLCPDKLVFMDFSYPIPDMYSFDEKSYTYFKIDSFCTSSSTVCTCSSSYQESQYEAEVVVESSKSLASSSSCHSCTDACSC